MSAQSAVGSAVPRQPRFLSTNPRSAIRAVLAWRSWVGRAMGGAAVLGAWQLCAMALASRHVLASPAAVMAQMAHDGFYLQAAATTLWEAVRGWGIGTLCALVFASVAVVVPRLETVVSRLGVISYCVPTIAVGPVLAILFSLGTTKVIMAALSVFFVTLVGLSIGLRSAPSSALDFVRSAGGRPWQVLVKVRLRAAVPASVAGVALGAPAAVLGAILGDYLGGTQGLGVLMLQAEESLQVARVWAVALLATVISGLLFGLVGLVGRRLSVDVLASADVTGLTVPAPTHQPGPGARWKPWQQGLAHAGRRTAHLLATLAGFLAVWWAAVSLSGLNPYFAKTPLDVWKSLGDSASGPTNASLLAAGLATTLLDAGLGFVFGTVAAAVVAGASVLSRAVESAMTPLVLVLRSVPMVAMVPLLALMLGNGLAVVVVTAALITFVPSVVTITGGLRGTPVPFLDLFRVCGSSSVDCCIKLRLRYAMPSLCAAARIAVPGAVLGAVLAEWLLSPNGLGHLMAVSIIGSNFNLLWASVGTVTLVSMVFYQLIGELEQLVTQRWSL